MNLRHNRFLQTLAFAVAAAALVGTAQAAVPKVEHGVLTDNHGMTLYTFAKDKANSGKSECRGRCAKLWPPDVAHASSIASGKFSFVVRADGKAQWAYKGKPLYYFARDKKPGQETGNGFKHIWRVALADTAQAAVPKVEHGVLTGDHGMTLYTFAKDKAYSGKSECRGGCAKLWPPDVAHASSIASGKFSFVVRADGKAQWAYKGKPLYYFARDKKPGQETGNGFKHIWSVARG